MLILTRKLGESITIGDNIKVSVLAIHGRQVRIGIEAPANVIVHREEIYVRIQEENKKAARSVNEGLFGMMNLLRNRVKPKDDEKPNSSEIRYKDAPDGSARGKRPPRQDK